MRPPLAIATATACLALVAPPGRAQQAQEPPPACSAERAGLVACVAGKLCACRHERASAAAGLPAGFRWDCGVLRPGCGAGEPPATLDRYPHPLPPGLGFDLSGTNATTTTTVTGGRDRVHNGGRDRHR